MLYRKMIKNAILSQYYDNCISINEYFSREVPLGISILLSMMLQMSGGVLLILLAITASEIFDGYLFFLYFSVLALLQSFFQSKRDFKTFDSLYEQSMFVYGYQNRIAIASNAVAYAVLNMINNPMVFVPYIIYPFFLRKNIFIIFFQISASLLIYCSVFFGTSNQVSGKSDRDIYENVIYLIKSILLVLLFTYMFRYFIGSEQDLNARFLALNQELKEYGSVVIKQVIPWMSAIITGMGVLFVTTQYKACNISRCICYGEEKKRIWNSKWVLRLAQVCRDRKVKSDLLIIGRRKDLWKYNSNLAFLIPNTTMLVVLFIVNIVKYSRFDVDVNHIIITSLIFDLAVIERFIFRNMSFILFYHSELKNIELYKKCKKDTKWLFWKKLKLMCWLSIPSVLFSIILFMVVAAVCKAYIMIPVIIPFAVGISIIISFLHLYWMFCYKGTYTEYEEFGTKKISLSVLNQLTSVPVGLLCLPFFMIMFNGIIGTELFTSRLVGSFLLYVLIFSVIISTIVFRRSLKTYGK